MKAISIKLMNYNQLNFYHRNPFYQQDFLPDRAWYNRESKAYPSQMPSGKDFLPDIGRKHFMNRFNHSEIQEASVLKSPERYPFENRIAMEKQYMRSLNTIDIEGASSNTRINQSIKNKHKAQEHISQKHNYSLQLKQRTEEDRRKEVALKQYENYRTKENQLSSNQAILSNRQNSFSTDNPQNYYNPSVKTEVSQSYQDYIAKNSNHKFKDQIPQNQLPKQHSTIETTLAQTPQRQPSQQNKRKISLSKYQSEFNGERMRNSEEYKRILEYEQLQRKIMKNPKDIRRLNPSTLSTSINMAGQSIVSS